MTQADGRISTKIRKHLRKLFFAEKNKGALLNELLEKHYGKRDK